LLPLEASAYDRHWLEPAGKPGIQQQSVGDLHLGKCARREVVRQRGLDALKGFGLTLSEIAHHTGISKGLGGKSAELA
jgi:hypothetical protein